MDQEGLFDDNLLADSAMSVKVHRNYSIIVRFVVGYETVKRAPNKSRNLKRRYILREL